MFTAEGVDSIPGQGTTILQTAQDGQERKKEKKKSPPRIRGKKKRKNEDIVKLIKTRRIHLSRPTLKEIECFHIERNGLSCELEAIYQQ